MIVPGALAGNKQKHAENYMFPGVRPDVPGDPENHENIVDYSTFQNPARRAAQRKQTGRKTAVSAGVSDAEKAPVHTIPTPLKTLMKTR